MISRFVNRIKDAIARHSLERLAENVASLSILQVINYLLPLVTLPYLVRILGVSNFGLVMFAVSFIQYFLIFSEYGFNISATHDVSVNRESKEKVSEIFFSVMIIKLTLSVIGFIMFSAIIFGFSKFSHEWRVYLFSYGIVVGNALFPIWFFQGMERMKYITVMNIISKTLFTILIFLIIREPADFVYVPIFNSLGYIVAGLISLISVFRNFDIILKIPSTKIIFGYLKRSTDFFISRVSVALYTNSNLFVIGLFLGNTVAGYYSAAEKLFIAIRMVYTPLITALYPYMSKYKNIALYKKLFWSVTSVNFLVSAAVILLSRFIINIMYGSGFEMSSGLLKIFAATTFIMVPSIMLGYPYLAAMGHPKHANFSIIISSVFHIIAILIIIPFINPFLVAGLTFFTEFLVFIIRIHGVNKFKLWST